MTFEVTMPDIEAAKSISKSRYLTSKALAPKTAWCRARPL